MANLLENSLWENGIYQLEQTDPVLGGPPDLGANEGFANVAIQQLANRTGYLKDEIANVAAAVASAQFVDEINVSGVTPLIRMTETDEGVATDQAGMTMLTGALFVQAESGIIRFSDMVGGDLALLTARFGGVDQPLLHLGMMATQAQAEAGVTGGVWMDDIRVKQAIAVSGKETSLQTTSVVSGSPSSIPFDNTRPRNNEGLEAFTLDVTPSDAAVTLVFDVLVNFYVANNGNATVALFKDGDVEAIAANSIETGSTADTQLAIKFEVGAGTTDVRTYKVRIGSNGGGNITLNGYNGAQRFDGAMVSSIKVTEKKS